jgi:hypothetical protein
MGVTLKIVNTFDETFQARLSLEGNLDIQWERYPELKTSIPIQQFTLIYAHNYDSQTKILTIDPGDSLTLFYFWNFRTDDLVFVPDGFTYETETSCRIGGAYLQVQREKETFILTGRVKMFDKLGFFIVDQSRFDICHYAKDFVSARDCANTLAGRPCP